MGQVRDGVNSRWGVSNKLYELHAAGVVNREAKPGGKGYLWWVDEDSDNEGDTDE